MSIRDATVGLAVVLLGVLTFTVSGRLFYPFELEWMEGATVAHVARLLSGEGIYVRPSLDFVPFGYPALYYYVCVPVAWMIGPGLTALRLVSIGSTIATLIATWAIVRRSSGAAAALVSAGAFAGAYALSDGWYDLARVDALYVALLASVYVGALRASGPGSWAFCGLLAGAAFTAKQPAIFVIAPLGIYLLVSNWRGALAFGGTFVVIAAGTFIALDAASDGWYQYYVAELPRLRTAVSPRGTRALSFWTADLLRLWPAIVAGSIAIFAHREWRHGVMIAGLIGAAWLARLEGGAWNNAVMPAHLAAAILLGLALRPTLSLPALRWGVAFVQLALLIFDPSSFRPAPEARAQGSAFLQQMRELPQPILLINAGSWARLAGLREYAHSWAVTDVVWADRSETGLVLEGEIQTGIRTGAFATIITDGQPSWFEGDIRTHYQVLQPVLVAPPASGAPRRPTLVLQPR